MVEPSVVLARLGPRLTGATEWTVEIPTAACDFARRRVIAQNPGPARAEAARNQALPGFSHSLRYRWLNLRCHP